MFDTSVTIVGNALTMPEWRRLEKSQALVANFKVASTARRYDRNNNRWIDGDSLRVRVTCWRRLAEGVAASIKVGDPVIVHGRLYTRDWTTEDGQRRVMYELDAVAVGHDLARGVGKFQRGRPNLNTSEVDDAEAEGVVGGERSETATELNELYAANPPVFADDEAYVAVPEIGFDGADGPGNDEFSGPFADLGAVLPGDAPEAAAVDGETPAAAAATDAVDPEPGRGRRSRSRVPVNA